MQLLERYKELCPDFTAKIALRPALRVNIAKNAEKELVTRLEKKGVKLTKIPFIFQGYWYEAKFSLGATPEYLLGLYYLQEAASQIPAEILSPKPGETVLDMACAPGSKLTQMGAMMSNKGIIVGIDTDEKRLLSVRNNCARLGIGNSILYAMDGRKAGALKMQFDKILLDAPCSGNFATEKSFFTKRRVKDFENRAALQKELLNAGLSALKPGGILVYSTCSLEPEEDECVVDWAVKELGVKVEPFDINMGDPGMRDIFRKTLHPSVANCRRLWPHRTGTQGFFVAKIVLK